MPKVTIWMADGSVRFEECHVSMSPDERSISLMDDDCVNLGEPIPYADIIDIKIDLLEEDDDADS